MAANAAVSAEDDVEPVANETRDRIITGLVTVVPIIALGVAGWLAWERVLHWSDVIVFAICYSLTGLGVTVGFHRHLTPRSFKAKRPVRAALAELAERGARFVLAELPDDTPLAPIRELLHRCGFSEEARVPDYFADGVALTFLRCDLAR